MGAENDVRARVNGRVGEGFLICSHLVAALRAPVRCEDQNVRAGVLEFLHTGGDVAFAQAGPPRTVDADLQSVLRRDHLGFSGGRPRNTGGLQRSLRVRDAFGAEVIRVVVAERDALNAALHENIRIGRRAAEIEQGRGLELFIRKGALEVRKCELILTQILHHAGKRPGSPAFINIAVKIAPGLDRGERAVADHGDDKRVRLLWLVGVLHRLRRTGSAAAVGQCDRVLCQDTAGHDRDPGTEPDGDHEYDDQKNTGFGELHGVTFSKQTNDNIINDRSENVNIAFRSCPRGVFGVQ